MPDLLLEFLSEEIPARMQARAAEDLKKIVTDRLVAAGLVYEGAKAFVTPRRLALSVHGVPAKQPDIKEEKKGPRVGAPQGAIAGFLKAAGLTSIEQAKVQPGQEGRFLRRGDREAGQTGARRDRRDDARRCRRFPWPKSMRWGPSIAASKRSTTASAQLGASAAFDPRHLRTGDRGARHRSLRGRRHQGRRRDARPPLHGAGADQGAALRRLHRQARQGQGGARSRAPRATPSAPMRKNLAFAQGYELVEDEGLLAEIAGLVEWPVTLMGSFDAAFLSIPEEVIRATIRNNQKCFVLRDPQTAKLVNKFILVANERSQRRRQGDRRRQRARDPRAACRRQILLRDRPEDAARRPAAEIRANRFSREARQSGRTHRAHRGACRSACVRWSAPTAPRPSARRCCARPICSPRWSANSPNCKA